MAVVVRRATKADAEKIAEFSVALAEQHYGYDQLRFTRLITKDGAETFYGSRIGAKSAALFVAEIDVEIVGFAYMEYEPIIYAELATKVGWLHDIYVESDAQGSGAGKALIEAVKNEAKRQGANKVLLSVSVMNRNGQEFFEHTGFRTTMHEMMLAIEKE